MIIISSPAPRKEKEKKSKKKPVYHFQFYEGEGEEVTSEIQSQGSYDRSQDIDQGSAEGPQSEQEVVKRALRAALARLDMASEPIELAALGRPLFPGMLYDCRKDSFIPGVTLWDKKSLSEDLDSRPQLMTDLKFSSSDSLSSKASLLNVSASLKASCLGGLVEVGGSAKYLQNTKSSKQQSRVTMHYSETTRFDQLTMTQLGQITYPQVFDQKTATHVVTAVLYGAQAFMVFDRSFAEDENKQEIEVELKVIVKKIPTFSIEGEGAVKMTDEDNKKAEIITCTFHGDVHLEQSPTTYMEALEVYKKLPTLLKENPQNAVPIKVWLYPLCLLDAKAAQLEREISTRLISNTAEMMEGLWEVERTCNDLCRRTEVDVFSDIKARLHSFQDSFSIYKMVFQKELARVLPAIRGGDIRKWFNDPEVIKKMRENLCLFKRFSEVNKNEKSIRFIISAISNPSIPGSYIYLYENGKLTDTKFQPVSKPPPPVVKNVLGRNVSLKLQKSPTGETVKYRVEYKQVKAHSRAEEHWLVIDTADEDFSLTELVSGKQYLIRYRIVGKLGVSEASETVSPTLSLNTDLQLSQRARKARSTKMKVKDEVFNAIYT
ncbi:stonustoxin subunit alpha-like protein [Labeo rohita]|uniref:Stonustoxin subunit alpha-like protein n=1 Tax=Labeo rohita TaxID=84645 RepID=A0A498MUJ2_LABRO|nr:stonustoxin subunit alpha-like protein [Labeo rohita]